MDSEWQTKRLGDLCDVTRGASPRPIQKFYAPQGVPWIKISDATKTNSRFIHRTATFIKKEGQAKSVKVTPGDLIVSNSATPGIPRFVGLNACIHDGWLLLRNFTGLDKHYAFYAIEVARPFLLRQGNGSVFTNLKTKILQDYSLKLPPLPEQRRIAAVLGALDDKIELNRQMNATLEEMAQAIFKSWFIDFDGHDDLVESELGPIPRGWEVKPIEEMVEAVFDGPHKSPKKADTGPIFLGIKNLTGTGLDFSSVRHISEQDWPKWTKRVVPRAGDIVFSYEARLGDFAIIPPKLRCCLGRRLALVRTTPSRNNQHFAFHYFAGRPFQSFLQAHINPGSTVDRILLKDFPSYPFLVPPVEQVRRFEDMASSFWSKIHLNQHQSRTLAELRDALLPKLISGEIRIPEAEEQAQDVVRTSTPSTADMQVQQLNLL